MGDSTETAIPECEDLQDETQNQHVWESNNETKRLTNSCVSTEGQIAHN